MAFRTWLLALIISPRWYLLLNALIFQIGWFICILYGNTAALLFTACAFCFHFFTTPRFLADVIAVLLMVIIGYGHDALITLSGVLSFSGHTTASPIWLMCLWGLLGINLNHSLAWLYSRPVISGLLGAISGPLSYLAGVKLSAASFLVDVQIGLLVIALLWLLILPLHRFLFIRILNYAHYKFDQ